MHRITISIVATLLLMAFLSTPAVVPAEITVAGSRKTAPGFSLKNQKGARVSLAHYKDKVVLVNFWATWCHGCKQEIPWYMEFAKKYEREGFVVIGVSMDEDGWNSVKPFVKERKLNYPVVIGNEQLGKQYGGLDSMPVSVLIDREGRIADSHAGLVEKNGWEQEIRQLLQEPRQRASKPPSAAR